MLSLIVGDLIHAGISILLIALTVLLHLLGDGGGRLRNIAKYPHPKGNCFHQSVRFYQINLLLEQKKFCYLCLRLEITCRLFGVRVGMVGLAYNLNQA